MKIEHLSKNEALHGFQWDSYIEDFKGGSELELRQFVETKVQLDDYSFKNLLYRWITFHNLGFSDSETQTYYFLDNKSLDNLTIEQFKERFKDNNLKIFVENDLLTFKCGSIKGVFHNNELPEKPLMSSFLNSQTDEITWMCHEEGLFPHPVVAIFDDSPTIEPFDNVNISFARFYIDSSPNKEEKEIKKVLDNLSLFPYRLSSVDAGWRTKEWCAKVDLSHLNPRLYNWKEIGGAIFHALGDSSKISIYLDRQNIYSIIGDHYDCLANVNLTVRKASEGKYVDDEETIMSALSHGQGDMYGY